MNRPLVCVVIANYNGKEKLSYCVPSVLGIDYPNILICVVDNASDDLSGDLVKERFPTAHLLENTKNLGYAGAVNTGIGFAVSQEADYILVLSNDMLVDDRAVRYAVEVANSDSAIGIIGFRLYGRRGYDSVEVFERACRDWNELTVVPDLRLAGTGMFLRVAMLDRIGIFDETYFMYGEDDDFLLRAKMAGYKLVSLNIPMWHDASDSIDTVSLRRCWLSTRSEIRFHMKHYGFVRGLCATKTLLSRACNPLLSRDLVNNRHALRSRPSNIVVNGTVVLVAFIWNLVNFRRTRKQRQRELNMVNRSHFADSIHCKD